MNENNVDTICLEPPAPSLDATHLNALIWKYIDACQNRSVDAISVKGYTYKLKWFLDWWDNEGPRKNWIMTPDDMVRFEMYLRNAVSSVTKRKLAYNTRESILGHISSVFTWAFENHYVSRNYSVWVPAPGGAPPIRRAATIEMLYRLIQCAEKTYESERNKAILALFIGMGLRRAEVAALNIEDIVIEADFSGYARVIGKRTSARGDGRRDAAFDIATGKVLIDYLDTLNRDSGPLFISRLGSRPCNDSIYRNVKRLIDTAELSDYIIGPHDLRRAFATHNWRTSKDIKLLQGQLGHANPSTTWKYTLIGIDDIRSDLVSPLTLLEGRFT